MRLRFKNWSRTYTPAPPTTSHCAASNAQPPAVRVLIREMGSEARASLSSPRSLASAHRFGRAQAHVPMHTYMAYMERGNVRVVRQTQGWNELPLVSVLANEMLLLMVMRGRRYSIAAISCTCHSVC